MSLLTIYETGNATKVSILNDCFKKDNVKQIYMYIRKSYFAPHKMEFSANVEFKNGNTEGKQSIEADDFNGLVLKVEAFINSL